MSLPLAKIIELAHSENVHLFFFSFFYLAVNKLITDKLQNIFLITEHSGFMKINLK